VPEPRGVGLDGVRVFPLVPRADDRGSLTETFRSSWVPGGFEVAQANLSVSRAAVLRGLHVHRRQADLWCVVAGRAFVALFDLRAGSPTHRRATELVVDAAVERLAVFIPPGVAHGFCAVTEVTLQYLVDRPFDGTDEFGVAWDDPEIGISWPERSPVLSARDRSNPSLARFLAEAPAFPD